VLLDELNIVLRYDYLPLDEVLDVLRNKPATPTSSSPAATPRTS
jgi:ATP:corrinoid adenosyltransferase